MTEMHGTFFDQGARPALQQGLAFSEARHRLILSNIANSETPGYRRQDLDEAHFEELLGAAIERQRDQHFQLSESVLEPMSGGRVGHRPPRSSFQAGPLRHDGNDVSLEREMALLAQNASSFRAYAELLAKSTSQIRAAIAERPGG